MHTETKAASAEPLPGCESVPGPQHMCPGYWLIFGEGLLTVRVGVTLILWPALGTLYLLLSCFVQSWCQGFCFVLLCVLFCPIW